jgi:uncharacterized protein (DUF58 family)
LFYDTAFPICISSVFHPWRKTLLPAFHGKIFMSSTPPPNPGPAAFDPSALARFGRLELIARLAVEGLTSGLHPSPFKGSSAGFAEHRAYGPGDEIRHIDWRAFAKTDRYYVKEHEEETNLKAHLVVDASGSMAYRGRTISKFECARQLAAALAYLMISQRDAVGLALFARAPQPLIPPRAAPGHFSVLCKALEEAEPAGEAALSAVLHALADRIKRRGLVIIISDGFDRLDDLNSALRHLRHRRHEVLFFQVLAPEEEEFPFRRPVRFRSLENSARVVRTDPAAFRAQYLRQFRAFCQRLREEAQSIEADYQRVSTADPPEQTLLTYLASRSQRGR